MNEIELSNDLTKITTEIKTYQSIGGQAIFEIGRRLKWVKDNDLAHGEFGKWLETIDMNHNMANKFMKIVDEIPNYATSHNLGTQALYEIATMPEDEREKPQQLSSGETKMPDEMTVRELREVKKQLKAKDDQIAMQARMIDDLNDQEPKVVEKEVVPADYHEVKNKNADLYTKINKLEDREKYFVNNSKDLKKEIKRLEREIEKNSEKTAKYDQLNAAINQAQGQLDDTQKKIADYKKLSELIDRSDEFLFKASSLVYADFSQILSDDSTAVIQLHNLIVNIERFLKDLKKIADNDVLEGEIIDG